jgi:phosphate/sulfate permease
LVVKVEWNFAGKTNGELYVMIYGVTKTLKSSADKLDTPLTVLLVFVMLNMVRGLVVYGWIMFDVLGQRLILMAAPKMLLVLTTVAIMKMLESAAHVRDSA